MEQLRAKWIKAMKEASDGQSLYEEENRYLKGMEDAFFEVLRSTEVYSEQLSILIEDINQAYREANDAYYEMVHTRQLEEAQEQGDKAKYLGDLMEKLELLNQGKEVRT